MDDERVIQNDVTVHGLRRLHVVRMGRPVDMEHWMGSSVVMYGLDTLQRHTSYEPDLGVHHLYMWWHAREPMKFCVPVAKVEVAGVMWWIGQGERMSAAIDLAATRHWLEYGTWPSAAYVREIPRGATAWVEILDEHNRAIRVRLAKADWAPKRVLMIVGAEAEQVIETALMREEVGDGCSEAVEM